MCGIAGLISTSDRAISAGAVRRMVRALARRGPDGEGIEVWNRAVLGHRRLAIFDLSDAGSQPMVSANRTVGVVFNGAIYNFRELRSELLASGYSFKSGTDTEVLIHGYAEWGLDGLVSRLRGMFAFGLWDDYAQKLYLVRDRLGVKPLVYSARDGSIAFASTVRSLRVGGFAGEIDERAVAEYLEFGFVTDQHSIYRGVAKVPAASIVEWSDGAVRLRKYWSPPAAGDSRLSFGDAVEEAERLFLRAVERRLQADVPVGALLSGGIDSSLVCWAIAKLGSDVTAYTIGAPGDPWDETVDAKATARTLKLDHRVLNLQAEDAPDLDELVSAYAEPFACASALGMLRVSRAVSQSATVLLTGDGGDDVFLGYPEHRKLWLAEKAARVRPSLAADLWMGCREKFPRSGFLRKASSFLDYTAGGIAAVACARDGLPAYRRKGLLGERLADATVSQREVPWSSDSARRLLTDFLEQDLRTRFVGEYMTKVDGATMHYGLEARSPFLDQELWEYAATLPFDLRLRGGRLKAVLRELARRRIGKRVASGRKRGFGVPVQRWLAGSWRNRVEERLRDSVLDEEGWIRSSAAQYELKRAAQEGWAPQQLWYIFVLECWMRREQEDAQESFSQSAGSVVSLACSDVRLPCIKQQACL